MRFLSLALLSGCALIDAGGDPHGDAISGDGPYTTKKVNLPNFNTNPSMVVPANLDGDGKLDFLVLSNSTIFSAFNLGNDEFTVLEVESGYQIIAASDLDGDGIDEPVGAAMAQVLDIFAANGTSFTRRQIGQDLATMIPGSRPKRITTVRFPDLQPAGRLLALSFIGSNQVFVISNVTAGGTPTVAPLIDVGFEPFDILGADIGSETPGVDSLVVAADTTLVEVKRDAGQFMQNPHDYAQANLLAAGRFLGGTGNDIALTRRQGGVAYVKGTPMGLPMIETPLQLGETNLGDLALATVRLDTDDLDDLVLLDNRVPKALHFYVGQGGGSPTVRADTLVLGDRQINSMAAGDFNGDGISDFLIAPGDGGQGVDLLLSN